MNRQQELTEELRNERAHSGDLQRALDHVMLLFVITGDEALSIEDIEGYDIIDILDFERVLSEVVSRFQFYDCDEQKIIRKIFTRWEYRVTESYPRVDYSMVRTPSRQTEKKVPP